MLRNLPHHATTHTHRDVDGRACDVRRDHLIDQLNICEMTKMSRVFAVVAAVNGEQKRCVSAKLDEIILQLFDVVSRTHSFGQ